MRYVRASEQDESKIRQFLGRFPSRHWSQNVSQYVKASLGGVFLAVDDDAQVAGCIVLTGEKSREMYIVGMELGDVADASDLAKGLAQAALDEAAQAGAHVLRALIDQENDRVLEVLKGPLQFGDPTAWEVGTLVELPMPKDKASGGEAGPAWAVDRERLFAYLAQTSDALWAANDPWLPRSLTEADLAQGFEIGGEAIVPQDITQPVKALALYRIKNRERLNLGYLKADDDASRAALLSYLVMEAHAWGVTELRYGLHADDAEGLTAWYGRPVQSHWRGWLLERLLHPAPIPS